MQTFKIPPFNKEAAEEAYSYIQTLTKPPGSLGKLEDIAVQLAGITGKRGASIKKAGVLVFAADHGITEEGVSAFPQQITGQMAKNFQHEGAAINAFAKNKHAAFQLVDIGMAAELDPHFIGISRKIGNGTKNFRKESAMTKQQAEAAVNVGREEAAAFIEANELECFITGEMGIGNTTSSSAVLAALYQVDPAEVTGAGTGLDDKGVEQKQAVIRESLAERKPNPADVWSVLTEVGGFEIAGMTGAMLEAAQRRIPIIVDGFINTTAALAAVNLCPEIKSYLLLGHRSAEKGHAFAMEKLGLEPILDLGMRLGEGTGALLAHSIVEASSAMVIDMATFDDLAGY
ncbi:nicotinate-nucleotide--dimethylbenzimidazole phosphoribosyltransferase [Sinobaca sp. H24]|uniref:nicotinate-nucleotide--dimethylbenzimidazole phosphoribosyltransferase n=1 Tax=Sinobaca sp. H24 TaxID=2923376 RepID=UPI0020799744|nr:nicotinate-nucleotide--dimethylbenzimidazole phosphoribosyltransferase [Sinobaca sp. H24]